MLRYDFSHVFHFCVFLEGSFKTFELCYPFARYWELPQFPELLYPWDEAFVPFCNRLLYRAEEYNLNVLDPSILYRVGDPHEAYKGFLIHARYYNQSLCHF